MVVFSAFGCGVCSSVCCVGAWVLTVSSSVVEEGGGGWSFGHCLAMCPGSLHLKQFGWSVVANIRYWVSSYDTIKDGGILSTSSGFTYICRLKLNM